MNQEMLSPTDDDQKRRILVADDDPAILRLVTTILERKSSELSLPATVKRLTKPCKAILTLPPPSWM